MANKPINIRGNSKTLSFSILVVFIILISGLWLWYTNVDSSYIDFYAESTQYEAQSYSIKVNEKLKEALQEINENNNGLNGKYEQLKFQVYYEYDPTTKDSIYDWNRIRLIAYKPSTKKDSLFYFNSHLENDLELQRINLDERIFKIFPNKERTGIDSIKIEKSLHNSKLDEYFWEGILVSYDHNLYDDALVIRYRNEEYYLRELNRFSENTRTTRLSTPINVSDSTGFTNDIDTFLNRYKIHNDNEGIRILNGVSPYALIQYADSLKIQIEPNVEFRIVQNNYNQTFNFEETNTIYRPIDDYEMFISINKEFEFSISKRKESAVVSKMITRNEGLSRKNYNSEGDYLIKSMSNQIATYQDKLKYGYIDDKPKQNNQIKKGYQLSINKTLNSLLNNYIEERGERLKQNKDSIIKDIAIGVTLMNPKTGEIIACVDYDSTRDSINYTPNINFSNHWIGSTFKPILASSAIAVYPSLQHFRLNFDTNQTSLFQDFVKYEGEETNNINLLGYTMPSFFRSRVSGINSLSANNFDGMFQYSTNVYPNALLLLALAESGVNDSDHKTRIKNRILGLDNNNRTMPTLRAANNETHSNILYSGASDEANENLQLVESENINNTTFGKALKHLFNYNTKKLDSIYDIKYIYPLKDFRYVDIDSSYRSHIYSMSPQNNTMYYEHMIQHTLRSYRGNIVSWVLGAGNNEWSNIKLLEAYARIISRKDVLSTFSKVQSQDTINNLFIEWENYLSIKDETEGTSYYSHINVNAIDEAWDRVVDNLSRSNTANRAISTVNNLNLAFAQENLFSSDTAQTRTNALRRFEQESFRLLSKTGTPNLKIDPIYNGNENGTIEKYRYRQQGLFAFSLMLQNDFNNLQALDDYSDLRDINTGLVGIIYVRGDIFRSKRDKNYDPSLQETTKISSSDAVTIFSDSEFLKALVLLNNELFVGIEQIDHEE